MKYCKRFRYCQDILLILYNGRIFRLSIRNLGTKWCVQYVDFTDDERLIGYVWYSTELVDALYKAVKNCAIYFRKVYITKKTE